MELFWTKWDPAKVTAMKRITMNQSVSIHRGSMWQRRLYFRSTEVPPARVPLLAMQRSASLHMWSLRLSTACTSVKRAVGEPKPWSSHMQYATTRCTCVYLSMHIFCLVVCIWRIYAYVLVSTHGAYFIMYGFLTINQYMEADVYKYIQNWSVYDCIAYVKKHTPECICTFVSGVPANAFMCWRLMCSMY